MNILLIDLSAIAHQAYHLRASDPNPDATSIAIVERVRGLASGQPHVGLALDSPPYFRSEIDPLYKANRKAEDRAPLYHQIALALDVLKADGYPVLAAKGMEADDVIASVCAHPFLPQGIDGVLIASSDKDLMQLVSDRVRIKSLTTGDIIDADYMLKAVDANLKPKIGIRPEQVVDFLALCGDTSDNVKGAEKVGPVGARALLQEFGSLDAMYAAFDKGITPTLTPNLRTRLQDFRPRLETVRSLIRLRTDAPIDLAPLLQPRVATNDSAVVFDDDPTSFIGFGHADTDLAAAHADVERADQPGVNVQAAPSQDILDDLRDVFAERNGDQVDRRTGEVLKPAFADAIAGQAAPVTAEAFAERAATAGEHTGPAVAAPAAHVHNYNRWDVTVQRYFCLCGESVKPATQAEVDAAIAAHRRASAERETGAADRPAGERPMGDSDALQADRSGRPVGQQAESGAARGAVSGRDRANGGDSGRAAAALERALQVRDQGVGDVLPVAYERQLEPRSLSEAHMLAKAIAAGRLFNAYGSGEAVLTALVMGRELGFNVGATLRAFHIVDSKPMLAADALRALVLKSGAAEYFRCTERTAQRATFVTKRKDDTEPMTLTFSIEEARAAWPKGDDAWAKSGWGKNPADMLVARASAKLARLVYPDIAFGIYTKEEID